MTSWTVAHQAPLSMGFPRQEHWSGLPFPSPREFPDPGIEPESPSLAGGFFIMEPPGKPFSTQGERPESGLVEMPLICTSPVWGQCPGGFFVFCSELPQGSV